MEANREDILKKIEDGLQKAKTEGTLSKMVIQEIEKIPRYLLLPRSERRQGNINPQTQQRNSKRLGYLLRKCEITHADLAEARKNVRLEILGNKKRPCLSNEIDRLEEYAENDGSDISSDKVGEAVNALLTLLEDDYTKDKTLLGDEGKDIYMQITSIKVPKTGPREIRVVLPHSLLPDHPDVCLISSDLEKGKRVDHAPTLEHVKNILSEQGVTEITEVITLRQLKTEYDQYELKRALCNRFDIFLCDSKVSGHVSHLLGKVFFDRRKLPVPMTLHRGNLKKHVEIALRKSSFRVSNKGSVSSLKVAHTLLTKEQIHENIMAAVAALPEVFPGGWDNVMHLMIKGAKSIPVPFYMSTKRDNDVSEIAEKPLKPFKKNVVGYLPGAGKLLVRPSGDIYVLEHERKDKIEREVRKEEIREKRQRAKENWIRKRNDARSVEMRAKKRKLEIKEEDRMESDESEEEEEAEANDDDEIMEMGGDTAGKRKVRKTSESDSDEKDVNDESKGNKNFRKKTTLEDIEAAYVQRWAFSNSVQETSEKQDQKQKGKTSKLKSKKHRK